MKSHNIITVIAEYCRARRIPYKIKNEALYINGKQQCFSLYNLTYIDAIKMIDIACNYNPITTYYSGLRESV